MRTLGSAYHSGLQGRLARKMWGLICYTHTPLLAVGAVGNNGLGVTGEKAKPALQCFPSLPGGCGLRCPVWAWGSCFGCCGTACSCATLNPPGTHPTACCTRRGVEHQPVHLPRRNAQRGPVL